MITIKEIDAIKGQKPRISALEKKEIALIVGNLVTYGKMVGIEPVGFDKDVLDLTGDWLKNHFSWISSLEIKHAFECYAAGKLPLAEKHFGKFSLFWLGSLLTEYKSECESARHLSKQAYKPVDTSRQLTTDGKDTERRNSEEWKGMLEWIARDGQIPPLGNWDWCYDHLEKIGRISLSLQEKKDFAALVMGIINREADELKGENMRKDFRKMFLNGSVSFKTKCKWEYMKQWIFDQVALSSGTLTDWANSELAVLTKNVA